MSYLKQNMKFENHCILTELSGYLSFAAISSFAFANIACLLNSALGDTDQYGAAIWTELSKCWELNNNQMKKDNSKHQDKT